MKGSKKELNKFNAKYKNIPVQYNGKRPGI